MAITNGTEWEIRTTGSSTNGGGFYDSNPGTSVDYSQQAAAQLSLSDIASDGAGTGISSTTGGFTAAMEGNVMYIAGTGFTTGWYQITAYTDTNNITIDRSCGASASGGTGNVGGAWKFAQTLMSTFFSGNSKGNYDKCHVKSGTYTGVWGTSLNNAFGRTYMRLEGYNTTRGDAPTGTNRPLLDLANSGSWFTLSASYQKWSNLRINSTYSGGSNTMINFSSLAPVVRNCKFTRSGFTGCYGVTFTGDLYVAIQCEFVATSGIAVRASGGEEGIIQWSYFHDSTDGFEYSGSSTHGNVIDSCIFDTCTGVATEMYFGSNVSNCTIYNCGTGIKFNSYGCSAYNNILHTCTTGINSQQSNDADHNILYNCTTPRTGGIEAGPNSLTSDPKLSDPANQDFTLDALSPAFNAGAKLGSIVGLP
jgi:hypothetical protein